MSLMERWRQHCQKELATVAMREQLEEYQSAFFAGAQAAVIEIANARRHGADVMGDLLEEVIKQLEARKASQ